MQINIVQININIIRIYDEVRSFQKHIFFTTNYYNIALISRIENSKLSPKRRWVILNSASYVYNQYDN